MPKSDETANIERQLIGGSDVMRKLRDVIAQISKTDVSVLITGEAGTGKGVVTQLIHQCSPRRERPFIAANLAAVSPDLATAELVGTVKGAFTDARDHPGLFEQADGGSIYLDELENAPAQTQMALIRILEFSTVRRLGSENDRKVNVRIIASSRTEMSDLSRSGLIRLDLFHRLAAAVVRVPPLRERLEDIPELVRFILDKYHKRTDGPVVEVSDDAILLLQQHDYPGNVRELYNIIMSAAIRCLDGKLLPQHLSLERFHRPVVSELSLDEAIRQLNAVRAELESLRRMSIPAEPIWEGRSFPVRDDYCFVLMPFSDVYDVQQVYENHVKPIIEKKCGLACERADDIYDISGVMQSVWEGINRARLVVADLTDRNPNVFYELGIAHTLGKPVIMLTQSMDFVPFDLRHLRCIVYDYKPATIKKFEQSLQRTVKSVLSSTSAPSLKLKQR